MTALQESLTIRITADSSDFRQELSQITRLITQLEQQFKGVVEQRPFTQLAQSLASTGLQLQQLSGQLNQVSGQIAAIAEQPVMIDVSPALNSLSQLSQMIAQISAQMQGLSQSGVASGLEQPVRSFPENTIPSSGYELQNSGFPQNRLPAEQQTSANMNAATFNQNSQISFLERQFSWKVPAHAEATSLQHQLTNQIQNSTPVHSAEAVSRSVSNFGNITVQIQQPQQLRSVLEELSLTEVQLRNRRG